MASSRPDAAEGGPLRLLWLIDSLAAGGAESLVGRLERALDPRRVRLTVAFLKSLDGNPFEDELRARGVVPIHLRARNLRDVGALRRLRCLVREEKIDVIHAHLTYAAIFGALAARLTKTPLVATLHVVPRQVPAWSRPGLRERIMSVLLDRWAATVVAVSGAVRDAYVRAGRIRPEKLVVVHNGIDAEVIAREDERREEHRRRLELAPEAKAVVTVSVLRAGKGLDVMLRAARLVVAAVPNAVFLVAGDGPLLPELRAQADELGLGTRVRWLGFRRDVPALLAAADLFVLPSLEDALPTALLEALAAGLPIVATRTGGIPEIVDAPRTGRLVAPGDDLALGRAIADLLAHPDERAAMAEAGRRRARAWFSSEAWVERLEAVYARAVAGRGGTVEIGAGTP